MSMIRFGKAHNKRERDDQSRVIPTDTDPHDFEAMFERLARIATHMERMTVRRGIVLSWLDVLRLIANCAAGGRVDLATSLHLPSRTITHQLNTLERKGFICRNSDSSDRRMKWITLTSDGEMFLAAAQAIQSDVSTTIFGELNEMERGRLINILRKIIGRLALSYDGDSQYSSASHDNPAYLPA